MIAIAPCIANIFADGGMSFYCVSLFCCGNAIIAGKHAYFLASVLSNVASVMAFAATCNAYLIGMQCMHFI